jgi:hypothetical protein
VYDVEVFKTPYFESFIKRKDVAQTSPFTHDPIPLFDVALKGIESGYRQCFRLLPGELPKHRILCETYKFLQVDVLNGMSLDTMIATLELGKSDYEIDKGKRPVQGNKEMARDAAFQLLYLLLLGQLENVDKDVPKLYNAVVCVLLNPGTFKYKAKRMVRAAFESRFGVTTKQRSKLDEWERRGGGVDENDATTDEDDTHDIDDWYETDSS